MTDRRSTIKDVAKRAGVSFTLVSKYLNHNPAARMAEETRIRIDEAVVALNYRPSAAARTLRCGHSHTIGMVCGPLTNLYFAHAADCALKECQKHGYQLMIVLADPEDPVPALRMLSEHNVDGIYGFSMTVFSDSKLAVNCPLIVNHIHTRLFSELDIDAVESLASGIAAMACTEIEGLFVKPTHWIEQFKKACALSGCRGNVVPLPLDNARRWKALEAICHKRPPAIFTNGWETLTCLLEILDGQQSDYAPKLLLHANCMGPFLGDRRIKGVITSSSTQLIQSSCQALIAQIEGRNSECIHQSIPSRFIKAGTQEYQALVTRHFQLT